MLLKNVKSDLFEMGDAAIFDLLVLYANRCRKAGDPSGFKFFTNGVRAYDDDVLEFLPTKKDKTLLGYHERMNEMFEDYCLVCDELLQVNSEKQALLNDFTSELYRHVGMPNRFSEMGLYLGNYKKTPFGVHVDACGVFSIPVAGVKKFRLWKPEYVQKNPSLNRAFKYPQHLKASQLMELVPGDLSYWPSSAWHIAESDGSFSATWSLGIWVDKPLKENLSGAYNNVLNEKLGSLGTSTMTEFKSLHEDSGEVRTLPDSYKQAIKKIQSLTASELEEIFLKSWMQHISLQGFKTVPTEKVVLTMKSKVKLRSTHSPILWQKGRDGKIYFSFGGALVESSKTSRLIKLVESLNAGQTCLVSKYLTGKNKPQELAALQTLADAGAF